MSFRPPLWASLVTVLAVALFGQLSWWQYQRGQIKADIIARQGDQAQPAIQVNDTGVIPAHGRRVAMRGRWLGQQEILLDNQTHQQRIGVQVWTPFMLAGSGHLMLVNRGWLPASPHRDRLPETGVLPEGELEIAGYWRTLPKAGLSTEASECDGSVAKWPLRLNYPPFTRLECLYPRPLANGIVLLDPQAEHGFVRVWDDLGIPPQRHYGYAFQWAALAFTALILYLFLNIRRTSQ